MKKRTLKFMACAAMMALTLSVTACGGGSDDTVGTSNVADTQGTTDVTKSETEDLTEPEVEDVAEPEVEDEVAGDDESYATLEEAFSEPEVKAAMEESLSSMDMDGMEISFDVKGNDFIVIYKVLDTVIDDPDDFAEQMEPVMEQLGSVFGMIAEVFDELLEEEGATTVVVRFLDANDTLLIESSYKAE